MPNIFPPLLPGIEPESRVCALPCYTGRLHNFYVYAPGRPTFGFESEFDVLRAQTDRVGNTER